MLLQRLSCLVSLGLPVCFQTVRGVAPLSPISISKASQVILQMLFCLLSWCLLSGSQRCARLLPSTPKAAKGMQSDSSDVLLFIFLVCAPLVANGTGNCPPFPDLDFKGIQSDSSDVLLFGFLVRAPTVANGAGEFVPQNTPKTHQRSGAGVSA